VQGNGCLLAVSLIDAELAQPGDPSPEMFAKGSGLLTVLGGQLTLAQRAVALTEARCIAAAAKARRARRQQVARDAGTDADRCVVGYAGGSAGLTGGLTVALRAGLRVGLNNDDTYSSSLSSLDPRSRPVSSPMRRSR